MRYEYGPKTNDPVSHWWDTKFGYWVCILALVGFSAVSYLVVHDRVEGEKLAAPLVPDNLTVQPIINEEEKKKAELKAKEEAQKAQEEAQKAKEEAKKTTEEIIKEINQGKRESYLTRI